MIVPAADILCKLLRLAVGNETDCSLPSEVDWKGVIDLSLEQGVAAVAVDGMQMVYDSDPKLELSLDRPELEELKYEWFGEAMVCEMEYGTHLDAVGRLAKFYEDQAVPMMLLKGYGLSLNYPVPSHRNPGDIDVYLWQLWDYADQVVERRLKKKVDNSHHHHSTFDFEGYPVENHYDFVNVYSHSSGRDVEALFKRLADDKARAVRHTLPNGVQIFFPSPDLNALFVVRHCAIHFAAESITLRHLLDWALFVEKHHEEVDWSMFWDEVGKMGMTDFVLSVDAIAVDELGFDEAMFHTPSEFSCFADRNGALVARVYADIISPEFTGKAGGGTASYVWTRLRCWWHNRWKHRMVYSDSLLSTFFTQIRSHLMKPASITGK